MNFNCFFEGIEEQLKEELSQLFPSWNWEKDREHYTLVEESKDALPIDKKKKKTKTKRKEKKTHHSHGLRLCEPQKG